MPLLRSKVEALLRGEYLCSACAPEPAPNGYPKALAAVWGLMTNIFGQTWNIWVVLQDVLSSLEGWPRVFRTYELVVWCMGMSSCQEDKSEAEKPPRIEEAPKLEEPKARFLGAWGMTQKSGLGGTDKWFQDA